MTDSFSSTDSVRSAAPLRFAEYVTFDGPIPLERGRELPEVTVCYETWGELNEARDNAVLVCHAISGDSHVVRHAADDEPGWWEDMVGPGRPIDTDRFFVICPNVLGGCRGTTGPGSLDPETSRPYGSGFPVITIYDMVDVQKRLMAHLGLDAWRAVVGGSLGGHQAIAWAIRHPEHVGFCIALGTSPRLTSQALAFDVVGRNAILHDPKFAGGQYYDKPEQPHTGLAIARMLGHITYLSSEAMDAKFDPDRHEPRDIETAFEKKFSVGSYLAYQGHKFVERFDANSYITLSLAMDLFDLGREHEQRCRSFEPARCAWLVVSFSSDWLFPPQQSRDIVAALTSQNRPVTYCEITTEAGHDAFLLRDEIEKFGDVIRARLTGEYVNDYERRSDDELILDLIEPGASVLDLGCGHGHLLARLRERGHDRLCGVDVDQQAIIATATRGVDVLDYDLNKGLPEFADRQFDVVVLSATLQAIVNVEALLTEMLRVGERAIISFPNFAYHKLRKMFWEQGRLPRSPGLYDFDWHDTPNRRFPSIADFEAFCQERGFRVDKARFLDTESGRSILADQSPNLYADVAVYQLRR